MRADKLRPGLFPENFKITDGQQFAFGLARECQHLANALVVHVCGKPVIVLPMQRMCGTVRRLMTSSARGPCSTCSPPCWPTRLAARTSCSSWPMRWKWRYLHRALETVMRAVGGGDEIWSLKEACTVLEHRLALARVIEGSCTCAHCSCPKPCVVAAPNTLRGY